MLPPQTFATRRSPNSILGYGYGYSEADDDAYDYNSENLKCVDHTAGTSISRLVTGSSAGVGGGFVGGFPGPIGGAPCCGGWFGIVAPYWLCGIAGMGCTARIPISAV